MITLLILNTLKILKRPRNFRIPLSVSGKNSSKGTVEIRSKKNYGLFMYRMPIRYESSTSSPETWSIYVVLNLKMISKQKIKSIMESIVRIAGDNRKSGPNEMFIGMMIA